MARRGFASPTGAYVRADLRCLSNTEHGRRGRPVIRRQCTIRAPGLHPGGAFARNPDPLRGVGHPVIAAVHTTERVDAPLAPRAHARPVPSCVVLVIRGDGWRVKLAELARWIGVDQATLRRWRREENFARARGLAPDLLRALAPRAWRLTREEAWIVRAAYERDGSLGATHALLVTALLPAEKPAAREPTPTRSLFGRERAAAFNYKRGTDRVGAYGR